MTCAHQTNVSAQPWTCWEKITFNQGFVSKHKILSFENRILGKKKSRRSWGHFKNFGSGEQKPSVTDLWHKHLAAWLLYSLNSKFPWKRYDCSMSPRCSMSPHFTVYIIVIIYFLFEVSSSSNFPPNKNFKNFPFPPLFLPHLILKNFSSPQILLRGGRGSHVLSCSIYNFFVVFETPLRYFRFSSPFLHTLWFNFGYLQTCIWRKVHSSQLFFKTHLTIKL